MYDEEIKKILLERACMEIDSLSEFHVIIKENRLKRLGYADQLILLLGDFNEHLCSTEIKGVTNVLNELYRYLNSDEPISDGVRRFMVAFHKAKNKSVVFPSVDIIRNAVKTVVDTVSEV